MGEDKIDKNEELSPEKLAKFLKQTDFRGIINKYDKASKEKLSVGFNVFTMSSDVFYKENYHSDIIKAFLDPEELHGEGAKFLHIFLNMINGKICKDNKSTINIDLSDYQTPSVERESNRIDILIKGNKHCVIIENKINDAPDMDRQLPRYYEKMANDFGYKVDAIVYLTKTYNQIPIETGWRGNDHMNVYKRLINLPVKNKKGEISLLSTWLDTCCLEAGSLESIFVLRQYGKLLKSLVPNEIINEFMKGILKYFKNNAKDLDCANTIVEILQQLPSCMADHLKSEMAKDPINIMNIGSWQPNSCVIELKDKNTIFVYCNARNDGAYSVRIIEKWNTAPEEQIVSWLEEKIDEYKLERGCDNGKQAYLYRNFMFGQEEEVVKFVKLLYDTAVNKLDHEKVNF